MSEPQNLPPEAPCILSFKGPDAIRFLNGQVTQDASYLGDRSLPSCVTDAKGRLQYFVDLCLGPDGESLWVSCPKEHSEGLRERLERYLIADEVEVEDFTGDWWCSHGSGSHSDLEPTFVRNSKGSFGEGFDSWWPTPPKIQHLDPKAAEDLRIAARIPKMGRELKDGTLPPEAGLDRSAISYSKGCYIGQEVLSRIKSAGKTNRRLAGFEIEGEASAGDHLISDSAEVGVLTSVSSGGAPRLALGYLKKTGFEATEFTISGNDGEARGSARRTDWA